MKRSFRCVALILIWAAVHVQPASAQVEELQPDAAALKAFTELVNAYRARPALTVKSTIKIDVAEGEAAAQGSEVKAEFIFGQHRRAVVKLRGFTCYLNNDPQKPGSGTIIAIHEGTPHAYYSDTDDGSPYYKLLNDFRDIPFPELAIMLGEDAIDDVLLQFHPKAASGVVPTAVQTVDRDGKSLQQITLSGEHEKIDVFIDPETRLIQDLQLQISGGLFARPGATVVYKHTYDYETHEKPLDEAVFTFNPQQRQRVDLMLALVPQQEPQVAVDDEGEPIAGQHALVGNAAPGFVLSTTDGKAIDLNDLDGQVVVLDFWASWCGPCMAALPKLHEVARWASDEELPVKVLTVNVWEIRDQQKDSPDARLESARNTWARRKFSLPVLMDYSDETAAAYRVRGIPMTVIIRSDGVVHRVHVGATENYVDDLKRDIRDAIKSLEGAPETEPDSDAEPELEHE